MKKLLVALSLVGIAASPLRAETKSRVIPEDWLPALFPSIQSALAQMKEADSKTDLNGLSRQVAEMTDAQLYIAYVRLYERLSSKEQSALLKEQTTWLQKRSKAGKDARESGGTLAPMEANNAELTLTEERLRELRARLKKITNKDD